MSLLSFELILYYYPPNSAVGMMNCFIIIHGIHNSSAGRHTPTHRSLDKVKGDNCETETKRTSVVIAPVISHPKFLALCIPSDRLSVVRLAWAVE